MEMENKRSAELRESHKNHIFDDLNERQKQAVEHTEGPLLVLAGAGSGKTKVIAHRIAHIAQKGTPPRSILAVTFTNKAAEEMQKRISALIKNNQSEMAFPVDVAADLPRHVSGFNDKNTLPFVSTFHSLGVAIMRESGHHVGVPRNFSIFDSEDSLSLTKECLKELSLDPKQFQPSRMQSVMSARKQELETAEDVAEEAENNNAPFLKILARFWALYEQKLREHKALDFDDLLTRTATLFREHPKVLEQYQDRWRYIHVDEYQDTNHAQYVLANLLARKYKNICCVGDVDQSIYGWRGADFRNILNFQNDWPGAEMVALEENYRSTQNILDAANAVIEKNSQRLPKNLFTKAGEGAKIKLFSAANEQEEAAFVALKTKSLLQKGVPARGIAALFRTNFQSRVLEEALIAHGIPYQLLGVKFYERKEVKDILAYLRAAANRDDLVSLKRIYNVPARGMGKVLFAKYLKKSAFSAREAEIAGEFDRLLNGIQEKIKTAPASEAIKFTIEKSGYGRMLGDGTEEGSTRLANIQELVSLAKKYDMFNSPEGIERLLADAALMSDQDNIKESTNSVRLMTVHAAKGLEFNTVFVSGLEDGLFPHAGWGNSGDNADKEEEERRLFYVALTRAEKNLFLSHAFFRTIFGSKQANRPSRFLEDVPEHLIEPVGEEEILDSVNIGEPEEL